MLQVSCQNCKSKFAIDDADSVFYKKLDVPLPTFCPDCRFQRRCSYINVRNLYTRNIPTIGSNAISMYSPDKALNIVEDRKWWSDSCDVSSYGRDYDFKRSFFVQFNELLQQVPLPHLQRNYSTFENSDYCNAASSLKNCYLIINADNDEHCLYGFCVEECKHCVDTTFTNRSELCYAGVHLKNCYSCRYCEDCAGCSGLYWCRDCVACNECFACIGLRHKSYHIFNRAFSREDYQQRRAEWHLGSWTAVEKITADVTRFFLSKPRKFMQGRNNQDVQGDYIYQSKNVRASYVVEKAEECKFIHLVRYLDSGTVHAYDYTMFGVGAELVYEAAWCGLNVHNVKFSLWNYGSSDLEYCFGCHSSKNLFGCIGVRRGKYCILNKQYSSQEYEQLLPQIKAQMLDVPYRDSKGNIYRYGEFFPTELSPFSYNQTIAQEFCPLTAEECVAQGFGWYQSRERKVGEFLHWRDIPDEVGKVPDELLNKPILCRAFEENPEEALRHNCTQVFKVIPQELEFYRKMDLPLPRYCHNTRHHRRLRQLNPFRTWQRRCMCTSTAHGHTDNCPAVIETTFAPERQEIVYCEDCYMKEAY